MDDVWKFWRGESGFFCKKHSRVFGERTIGLEHKNDFCFWGKKTVVVGSK